MKICCFWGFSSQNLIFGKIVFVFGNVFGEIHFQKCRKERCKMRSKNYKGRCEKRVLGKCEDVCRTYDSIQYAYADILQSRENIKEIRCNIPLDGLTVGEYMTDFVCVKSDGDLMVRECVYRRLLMKPLTIKLLDASREYWYTHGVSDWGIVTDEEK